MTVDNADSSEWVGGLRRRDRVQGHKHLPTDLAQGLALSASGGSGAASFLDNVQVSSPVSDGLNGTPRVANSTDARGVGFYPYIWTKSFT